MTAIFRHSLNTFCSSPYFLIYLLFLTSLNLVLKPSQLRRKKKNNKHPAVIPISTSFFLHIENNRRAHEIKADIGNTSQGSWWSLLPNSWDSGWPCLPSASKLQILELPSGCSANESPERYCSPFIIPAACSAPAWMLFPYPIRSFCCSCTSEIRDHYSEKGSEGTIFPIIDYT